MEDRATRPLDGSSIDPVERQQVRPVQLVAELHVGQAFPAAADAEHRMADLGGPVDDALDDGVEPWHVAPAGQDADPFSVCHAPAMLPRRPEAFGLRFGCDGLSASRPRGLRTAAREPQAPMTELLGASASIRP
jgi:hypothetical protein